MDVLIGFTIFNRDHEKIINHGMGSYFYIYFSPSKNRSNHERQRKKEIKRQRDQDKQLYLENWKRDGSY